MLSLSSSPDISQLSPVLSFSPLHLLGLLYQLSGILSYPYQLPQCLVYSLSLKWSHWMLQSHRIVFLPFSNTPGGLCSYYLLDLSRSSFPHNSQLMYLATLLCLLLYSFWVSLLHLLTRCPTLSPFSPHILHNGKSAVLSMWYFV